MVKEVIVSFYNVFAAAATIICLLLAIFIYSRNRKGLLNKVFIATIVCGAYWAFTTFMIYQSGNAATALFWKQVGFLWPFFFPLVFQFTLVFIGSRFATSKTGIALLYLPTLFFSGLDLATNQLLGLPVVADSIGYMFIAQNNVAGLIFVVWYTALLAGAVFAASKFTLKTTEINKKQQAKFIAIGLSLPLILTILSKVGPYVIGIYVHFVGVAPAALFCIVVTYATWKYDLFNVNPSMAAENIIETMPDSFVLTDSDGQIIRINSALTHFLGYTEKELVGKKLEVLLKEQQNQQLIQIIEDTHEIKNQETQIIAKDNTIKPVSISSSIIKNKKGKKIGITVIIHDLTQHKQYEQKIIKSERFAAIGELAGMVGHDLRNPLSSMQTATYYLKKNTAKNMDTSSKKMLQAIDTSIQYSKKIVDDLLDYSREIKLELEATNMKDLTDDALALLATPPSVNVINLTNNKHTIQVDKVKLNRVFVNIIKNAFEAMPNGGTLLISASKQDNNIEARFEDTGEGMSKETIDNLWRPLFTTKAKGMGFGLPICKRIVEAHGGKIHVKSVLNQGTTFTVSIPFGKAL